MTKRQARIETGRLVLTGITDKDRQEFIGIFLNEEIKKTYMIPDGLSERQLDGYLEAFKKYSKPDGGHIVFGIFRDDVLIGFINETGINDDEIEIGYVIHPDHQGNGYCTEAVKAAICELFRIGFRKVSAGYFEGNVKSRRVMEKCGMTESGRIEYIRYMGENKKTIIREITAL